MKVYTKTYGDVRIRFVHRRPEIHQKFPGTICILEARSISSDPETQGRFDALLAMGHARLNTDEGDKYDNEIGRHISFKMAMEKLCEAGPHLLKEDMTALYSAYFDRPRGGNTDER